MNKIKDMLRGPKPAEAHLWLLFAVFAAVLTLKNLMATTIISHFLPPSEFGNVALFLLQFMPSLLPAMLLAILVFVLKHKWWTVVINVLVDLWAVTNVIYSRANGQLIDIATILLARNMDGTWKSLITYSHADMLLFPLLTALYVGVLIFCKRRFTPPPMDCVKVSQRLPHCIIVMLAACPTPLGERPLPCTLIHAPVGREEPAVHHHIRPLVRQQEFHPLSHSQ